MSAPPTSKVEGPKQKTEAELAPPDGDAPPVSRRARIANVIGIELLAPIAMVLGALAVWPTINLPENGVTVGAVRVLSAPAEMNQCTIRFWDRVAFGTSNIKSYDCLELLTQYGIDGVIALRADLPLKARLRRL